MGQSKRLVAKMLSCDICLCFELEYLHAKNRDMGLLYYIYIVWFFSNLELFPSHKVLIVIWSKNWCLSSKLLILNLKISISLQITIECKNQHFHIEYFKFEYENLYFNSDFLN